jgi:hypothetical membrane protein
MGFDVMEFTKFELNKIWSFKHNYLSDIFQKNLELSFVFCLK